MNGNTDRVICSHSNLNNPVCARCTHRKDHRKIDTCKPAACRVSPRCECVETETDTEGKHETKN